MSDWKETVKPWLFYKDFYPLNLLLTLWSSSSTFTDTKLKLIDDRSLDTYILNKKVSQSVMYHLLNLVYANALLPQSENVVKKRGLLLASNIKIMKALQSKAILWQAQERFQMCTRSPDLGLMVWWSVEAFWAVYWCEGTGRRSDLTTLAAQGGDWVTTLPITDTALCCSLLRPNGAYHQIPLIL